MRRTVFTIVALAMLMATTAAIAQDDGAPKKARKAKKAKAAVHLATLTLTGTIVKNDKGSFMLTTDDGATLKLPKPKARKKKDAPPAINLDEYVDTKVKLVGKGTEKGEGEKKKIALRTITHIDKLDKNAGADAGGDDF